MPRAVWLYLLAFPAMAPFLDDANPDHFGAFLMVSLLSMAGILISAEESRYRGSR